jgi:hypothetical protein
VRVDLEAEGAFYNAAGNDLSFGQHPTIGPANASGVGDVAVFAKYHFLRDGAGGLAAEVEMRLPTGDKAELRGLDVTRTLFTGIWSRGGRISPHASAGFELWSSGVPISGDGLVSARHQFKYAFGFEFETNARATAVFDVVGRHLLNGGQLAYQTFPALSGSGSIEELVGVSKGVTNLALAPGFKWNVWRTLLLTGNVLATLSNDGLRADVIPAIGLEWAR